MPRDEYPTMSDGSPQPGGPMLDDLTDAELMRATDDAIDGGAGIEELFDLSREWLRRSLERTLHLISDDEVLALLDHAVVLDNDGAFLAVTAERRRRRDAA